MEGDPYLVDCNVTGSDGGSSDKPCFSLMVLFCDQVFPKIAELTGPDGNYEGYPSAYSRWQCWFPQQCFICKLCDWVLHNKRVEVGASGCTDAPHEQSGLGGLSHDVEMAQYFVDTVL